MASNDLSVVIDPGGIDGVRPGINEITYPDGDTPINWKNIGTKGERIANASLKAGGFDERLVFNWSATVDQNQYDRILALISYNEKAKAALKPWQVVVYNLAQPYTEISESRNRYKVPSTSILEQTDLGNNMYLWKYYIALQGSLYLSNIKRLGKLYNLTFDFVEGIKLTKEMET